MAGKTRERERESNQLVLHAVAYKIHQHNIVFIVINIVIDKLPCGGVQRYAGR